MVRRTSRMMQLVLLTYFTFTFCGPYVPKDINQATAHVQLSRMVSGRGGSGVV